jgi:hypothetical protein
VPIVTAQIEVGTTRVLLHQTDADGCHLSIHAAVGAGSHVHIGGITVTTANGYELDGHDIFQMSLPPTEALYAIKDSGTSTVSILAVN